MLVQAKALKGYKLHSLDATLARPRSSISMIGIGQYGILSPIRETG